MKITYKTFAEFLEKLGYSAKEILHLYGVVKNMDKEIKGWVINWFNTGEFPEKSIEGVTVESLLKKCQCNELNAFIIMNWLKTDPTEAKYFLSKIYVSMAPDATASTDADHFLQQHNIELSDNQSSAEFEDIEV